MAGETPTPSFAPEAKPNKQRVREKIPVIRTIAEKAQQRSERKAERAARPRISEARLKQIRENRERNNQPALNITEDKRFDAIVNTEKAKILATRSGIMTELNGQTPPLTPGEIAKAQATAYEKFKQAYSDSAEQYAANGVHFAKNPDGTYSIKPDDDVFYRGVKQEAEEARLLQGDKAAQDIIDRFVAKYPTKAGIYATHGERALKDSLARGTSTPDANANVVTSVKPPEIVTPQSPEEAQVRRMTELAAKGSALSLAEMNEKKRLMNVNKAAIDAARALKAKLLDPNQGDLTDDELKKVEVYDALLNIPDTAPPIPNAPAVAETPAQRQQREAVEYQQTRGPQSFGELSSNGVDFTKGEQAAMQSLKQKGWTEDADTLEYIHAGFVEYQNRQAQTILNGLSPEQTAVLDKAESDGRLNKGDLLKMLALFIAMGLAPTLKDAATQATTP